MSKLQKCCPNYTQVCTLAESGGCLYTVPRSTPRVSLPLGAQFLFSHQNSLGEYPALTPRYWFSYLPAYCRRGVAKSYEAEKRLFATRPKPRLPLPLPTKTLIRLQETGGTVTHTVQVLHSLQLQQRSKDERALAQALTLAYHCDTHTLLSVVREHVSGPSCLPVKGQQNTALVSDCGLTGTPLRVSLSGLGGK